MTGVILDTIIGGAQTHGYVVTFLVRGAIVTGKVTDFETWANISDAVDGDAVNGDGESDALVSNEAVYLLEATVQAGGTAVQLAAFRVQLASIDGAEFRQRPIHE